MYQRNGYQKSDFRVCNHNQPRNIFLILGKCVNIYISITFPPYFANVLAGLIT